MRRRLLVLSIACLAVLPGAAQPPAAPAAAARKPQPKLVLAIAIDQFRYDYLTRFRAQYTSGLKRLLEGGADFRDAHHNHLPTVTAIGHSTFLSGATPAISGIAGNEWLDRASGRRVTSVEDRSEKLLGAGGTAASPRRLLVSTVGDQLKMSGKGGKTIGISLKDRSAILPAGHMADGAFWMDASTGAFVSSSYYFSELPDWAAAFNASKPADKYRGQKWTSIENPAISFDRLTPKNDDSFYRGIESTPWGNDLVEALAEKAVTAEKLGKGSKIDLLAISFSSNDYVGHAVGPDSPEARDMAIRTDRLLGKLFAFLDKEVGMANTLVVLTADHGVAPVPEDNAKTKMPGGRLQYADVGGAMNKALAAKYGEGKWIAEQSEAGYYLNFELMAARNVNHAEAEQIAAHAAWSVPHVFRVYTRSQLSQAAVHRDRIGQRVLNGWFPQRSGDILVLFDPYFLPGRGGTTHGSAFFYDTHVPILFFGGGVKPGAYYRRAVVNDIAPTLAAMLEIEAPSGSDGRVLDEMFR